MSAAPHMANPQPALADTVVRTVTGDRPVRDFERVLVHEHVLFDIVPPDRRGGDRDAPITMGNRWQIDYRSNVDACNAHQTDRAIAMEEIAALAGEGGDLIVDQSVAGLARDADGLRQVAEATGCGIVACAGTYTAPFLDEHTARMDVEALTTRFVAEISEGLDGTDVRAGLIGEIGCSSPLEPVEKRALRAAARAQQATGAAISVHPGRDTAAPFEIVSILEAEGADLARCAICHMDRTFPQGTGPCQLARTGVMVEWDFFGIETSHYWMADRVELPTDRGRLRAIRHLFDRGLGDRVLISQDICTRTRLLRWGGHGYGHIFRNVTTLMASMGFDGEEIGRLVRVNPLGLLGMPQEKTA
ncbi:MULTISPECIES: hypothetical protein [unclassified Roseitalea]|uniref:phosphotriesterase family protein n=1 Tax=unclassified Roseitalea TaxID=2639107 RepID=UPI00273DE500|nr:MULTISPECIES: hypothetical protein [unclassified Roseitalea]